MPLFMDVHGDTGDASIEDVVAAHLMDLQVQDRYDTRYITYWFNQDARKIFCLVEAPSKDTAIEVHRVAHGLLPDEIIEVQGEFVDSMMDMRRDQLPNGQTMPESGRPDTGFRAIMFTDLEASTERGVRIGDEAMCGLIQRHNAIIGECLHVHGGRAVKHTGDGMMASFVSVARAVECAIAIQQAFDRHNENDPEGAMRVRIGIAAGEPIENDDDLFGTSVNLARRTCDAAAPGGILATNVVRELCFGKRFRFDDLGEVTLKGFSDPVRLHEVPWRAV
jgi:class 3 adenylate cyclase